MATARKKTPDDRLHETAASKEGFRRLVELVEEEGLNIDQLHSEYRTPPIAFAAQSGSLSSFKYLLRKKEQKLGWASECLLFLNGRLMITRI